MSGASGGLTHFDAAGNAVMVDVSDKPVTGRTATARARVVMAPETLALIEAGSLKKGDVLVIPAGIPHWFKQVNGSINYLTIKSIKP